MGGTGRASEAMEGGRAGAALRSEVVGNSNAQSDARFDKKHARKVTRARFGEVTGQLICFLCYLSQQHPLLTRGSAVDSVLHPQRPGTLVARRLQSRVCRSTRCYCTDEPVVRS